MLNIFYCGTCKKCLQKDNFLMCDMCHNLLQGKCPCCNICDLCYGYEQTQYYSYKTGMVSATKELGVYLTICTHCQIKLDSPFTTDKKQQIIRCIQKTYPKLKLQEKICNIT